jgi:hypothetical protein
MVPGEKNDLTLANRAASNRSFLPMASQFTTMGLPLKKGSLNLKYEK